METLVFLMKIRYEKQLIIELFADRGKRSFTRLKADSRESWLSFFHKSLLDEYELTDFSPFP